MLSKFSNGIIAALLLAPLSATALVCDDWHLDSKTGKEIPFPGEDGYDPQVYGRHIYSIYGADLANERHGVFVGTLTPRFAPDIVWWHEQQLQPLRDWRLEQPEETIDTMTQRYMGVTYYYDGAFQFEGSLLSETDAEPVDFRVTLEFTAEFNDAAIPVTDGQSILTMEYHKYRNDIFATILGVFCLQPLPMPDDAFAVFQSCVADGECNP